MIRAFNGISDKRSLREGSKSVGATVGQCDGCPICLTKEHDRLFEESPAERSPADFFGPCGSVPCVSQIFCHLLQIGSASCREECVSTCRSRWSPYHSKKTNYSITN